MNVENKEEEVDDVELEDFFGMMNSYFGVGMMFSIATLMPDHFYARYARRAASCRATALIFTGAVFRVGRGAGKENG